MTGIELLPCPFCGGAMQLRYALWPSEGDRDAVIHNVPGGTACPIEGAFSIDTFDNGVSVAEAWNRRHPPASREEGLIDALTKVRDAILSPINSLAIVDTVWMPVPGATYSIETLVDFIDAQIALIPTKPEAKEEGFPWEISPDAWRQVVERIVKETERVYGPGPVVNAVRAALQSKKPE